MMAKAKAVAPQPLKSAVRRARAWLPVPPKPAILMYHRIAREAFDPWGLCVEQERFEAQLEWLARNRCVLRLSEFAGRHRERRLRRDAVAITFDDGYASAVKAAGPLLQQLGLSATIFLPVELIERSRHFWWDELARIILDFQGDSLRRNGSELPVPPADERDRIWAPNAPPCTGRQRLFQTIWAQLKAMSPGELEKAMNQLRSQAPAADRHSDRPITPDELSHLHSHLIEFGSHALTHPSLPCLSDEEKGREIGDSRPRCAALTGAVPASFAYPYGDYDATTSRLVEEAGFVCAVTAEQGFVTNRTDPFVLPRIAAGNWNPQHLERRLRGA